MVADIERPPFSKSLDPPLVLFVSFYYICRNSTLPDVLSYNNSLFFKKASHINDQFLKNFKNLTELRPSEKSH